MTRRVHPDFDLDTFSSGLGSKTMGAKNIIHVSFLRGIPPSLFYSSPVNIATIPRTPPGLFRSKEL